MVVDGSKSLASLKLDVVISGLVCLGQCVAKVLGSFRVVFQLGLGKGQVAETLGLWYEVLGLSC